MIPISNELKCLVARPDCISIQSRVVRSLALLAGAAFFCVASSVLAVPINYGDFMGNTVTYVDVTEDTNSGDDQPLFGLPTVVGDSLDFDPVGFDANATGAAGVDVTDGQLFFMVDAKAGNSISSLLISEAGDTTLSGFGTDKTFSAVKAAVFVDIVEVGGVGINIISLTGSLTFAPSGGEFDLANDGGGGPLFHTIWTGSLLVDLDAELAARNINGSATKINVNIDNTLMALSEDGTFALIAKKDFGGLSVTVPGPDPGGGPEIPEPASFVLAALGFVAVAAGRRSRG